MASTLRFHPSVVDDLTQAIDWYDERSHGLGDQFRAAVDDRLDAIAQNPERFGMSYHNLRVARLSRFPYVITFRILGEVVQIAGVFHAASDPEKWRRALD